jgi:hypothetical protein
VIVAGDSEPDFLFSTDARKMAERGRLGAAMNLALEEVHAKAPIAWVIVGGERQIEAFAERNKVSACPYYPDWRRYGGGAPAKAGRQMLRALFDPKVLLVFPAAKPSANTRSSIRQAEKMGIEVVREARRDPSGPFSSVARRALPAEGVCAARCREVR